MKQLFLIISILLFGTLAQAQMISGKVYEVKEGEKTPLPTVNVHWQDSQIGIMTDQDGAFSIIHPEGYQYLIFSFVGYRSDTLDVDDHDRPLEVVLERGTQLDEVQVVERTPGSFIDRIDPIATEQITGAELCKAACCNLSESFETNASVDAYYSNAITGAKQIRLLGLDGTYVQLLTENIPSLRGIATSYGMQYIPGPWMEAIAVSKGTSSVKNGYESIAGQINIEYLKPATADKFYLNLFGSDAGRKEANLAGSVVFNDQLSTLVLAHVGHGMSRWDHNDDNFLDQPLIKQYNFLNRWYYVTEKLRFHLGVKHMNESRYSGQIDYEPGAEQGFDQPYGIGIHTKRVELFSKLGYILNNNKNSSFGSIYSLTLHDQNSNYGMRHYAGDQLTYYMNLMYQTDLTDSTHVLITGFSYNYEKYGESLGVIENERIESVPGLFAEYSYKPSERLSVLAGLRGDFHNLYGFMLTPRLHSKIDLSPTTHLRLSAGRGSRTPYILAENNHFLANSRKILIDPNPKQEVAWNYGVNLTQYFSVGRDELQVNLEFYRTDFVNQIIMDLDSSVDEVRFFNLDGESFSNNAQIEMTVSPLKGLDLKAAARYSDVRYTLNNDLVKKPLFSPFKGLINASYQTPLKKWQFDFTTQFNGKGRIPSTASNPEGMRMNEEFPAFTIMNFQITKFFRIWEIYAGVENLTNFRQSDAVIAPDQPYGEYFDASLVWGPIHGRKIYAGMRFAIERDL